MRYYHGIGLLEPEYTDGTTNYRYYSTRQFEQLDTIKYPRALDISTQQIGEFSRHRGVDVMLSILVEQQQEVQRKEEELELVEKKIFSWLEQIDDVPHSNCKEIVIKTFPPRHLVTLKKEIAMPEDLEYPTRDLGRTHRLDVVIFLGKVGVSVSWEHLLFRNHDSFTSIFVALEEDDPYDGAKEILPQDRYTTTRFQGTRRETPEHYDRLLEYLERAGAALSKDSLEITMIDSGMTGDSSKLMAELQVPLQ